MATLVKPVFAVFFISVFLTLTSCGSSGTKGKLDKIEKVVSKWEEKQRNGSFSASDCAKMKKELTNAGVRENLATASDFTEELEDRAENIAWRADDLLFKCDDE